MRRSTLAAAFLMALAVARIASTFTIFSVTTDEPIHLGAGFEVLQKHQYRLQVENPPLPRIVLVAAPYAAGLRWPGTPNLFADTRHFFFRGDHYLAKLFLCRAGNLLFFLVASVALFVWARRELGEWEAVLATLLFTLQPIVLGYSGIANHDIAAAAGVALSLLAFDGWLRKPNARRAAIVGVAYGVSILCKFSCIPFVPAACGVMLLVRAIDDRDFRRAPRAWATLLAILPTALLTIGIGYLGRFDLFLDGVLGIIDVGFGGFRSYLFGHVSSHGWWWYFPVAVALKTPLAFLLLWIAGGVFACRDVRYRRVYLEASAAALAILAVSMTSTLDIGVRYVLPMYVPLTLAATAAAAAMARRAPRVIEWAASLLIVLFAVSSIAAHPDYFPYFNLLAGSDPSRYLIDSNLDWGQDMLRLDAVVRQRKLEPIGTNLSGHNVLDDLGRMQWPVHPLEPAPGWVAVSDHVYRMGLADGGWRWLEGQPMQRIGKSIRLYHLPANQSVVLAPPEAFAGVADLEPVLLPLAGTVQDQGAPVGMRWRIDQEVTNRGPETVRLYLSTCPGNMPCRIEVRPGAVERLASTNPRAPFIIAWGKRDRIGQLTFTTVVRRTDAPRPILTIPAVRERAFGRGAVEIANVKLSQRSRVNIRAWLLDMARQSGLHLRVTAVDGRVLFDGDLPFTADRFYTHGAFERLFDPPLYKEELARFRISVTGTNAPLRLWGFLTVDDGGGPVLYRPVQSAAWPSTR